MSMSRRFLRAAALCALRDPDLVQSFASSFRASVRYPSGPRGRSAKPLFAGSNPARTSDLNSLLLVVVLGVAAPAAALTPKERAAARAAILKDRADDAESLKNSPTSYLRAVARKDFGE